MKTLNLSYLFLLLAVFTSCKKDYPVKVDATPPVIAAVHDSVSYTVDGKTYTNNSVNSASSGNKQVNQKFVYNTTDNSYTFFGSPDSVLFYWSTSIISENLKFSMLVIKKYNKNDIKRAFLYYPVFGDWLKLYTVGEHPYAEDFNRENSQNGIALNISANGRYYSSYSNFDLNEATKLVPGFQKGSKFEIISFTKATSGGYNLEAKFNAIVVDNYTEEQKKVENGYLRLHLDTTFYPLL